MPVKSMSTLTKVSAELAQQSSDKSASPPVVSQKVAVPDVSSSPVCMEIPVRIRGLQGDAPSGDDITSSNSFTEDTNTLILFPRGAVVRLATAVTAGQELMLTNLDSNQHVHCKVLTVRASESAKGYVELEFTHRTAGFWGSVVPMPKITPATSAPEFSPANAETQTRAATLTASFGAALKPPFDQTAQSASPLAAVKPARMQHLPSAPPVSAVAALAATADAHAHATVESQPRSHPAPAGPRLDVQFAKNRIAGDLQTGGKWRAVGVSTAAVVLALTLGTYLLRSRPASTAAVPQNGNVAVAQNVDVTPAPPQTTGESANATPPGSPAASPVSEAQRTAAILATTAAPETTDANRPGAVRELLHTAATKLHLSPDNSKIIAPASPAHPSGSSSDEAPAIVADNSSSPASSGSAGSGIISGGLGNVAPPAKWVVPAPAPAAVKATIPRAISVVKPSYPSAAKNAHIEGDVVIQADVDALGKVVGTKVISGPALLQAAAVEALQQWKYEPAKLNGQAVVGKTIVSLNFRLP